MVEDKKCGEVGKVYRMECGGKRSATPLWLGTAAHFTACTARRRHPGLPPPLFGAWLIGRPAISASHSGVALRLPPHSMVFSLCDPMGSANFPSCRRSIGPMRRIIGCVNAEPTWSRLEHIKNPIISGDGDGWRCFTADSSPWRRNSGGGWKPGRFFQIIITLSVTRRPIPPRFHSC